ncbi:hypothetical protein GCM10009121_06730 [Rhodanobacter soli]
MRSALAEPTPLQNPQPPFALSPTITFAPSLTIPFALSLSKGVRRSAGPPCFPSILRQAQDERKRWQAQSLPRT